MYRFQLTTSFWSTTSANAISGNPPLALLTGAPGAGCSMRWLPGSQGYPGTPAVADQLVIVRGGSTSNIYRYDLQLNTMTMLTYQPSFETFTTGSCTAVCSVGGKKAKLILTKDATMKFFRFNFDIQRKEPIAYQEVVTPGVGVVGDKFCIINQSGVDMIYFILVTSSFMLRSAIII